ncbi:hypothetical protein D3C86_1523690 [compost metagenome]
MVLGADDVGAQLLLVVHLAQQALGRRASGGHHVLALQVGPVLDAAILLHHDAGADDEDAGRERDLLLAFQVIGRGTALDVDRAVLQQRDPVLRGNRNFLNLQVRQLQLVLHGFHDLHIDIVGIAHLAHAAKVVVERNRGIPHTQRNNTRVLDLLQRARQRLCSLRGTAQNTRSNRQASQLGYIHNISLTMKRKAGL